MFGPAITGCGRVRVSGRQVLSCRRVFCAAYQRYDGSIILMQALTHLRFFFPRFFLQWKRMFFLAWKPTRVACVNNVGL